MISSTPLLLRKITMKAKQINMYIDWDCITVEDIEREAENMDVVVDGDGKYFEILRFDQVIDPAIGGS